MKIITPFATFFATEIAGERTALFAHCPQHLSRLFQIVGLSSTWDCIYSKRFGCYIAVATLEHDDFTLLTWEIQSGLEEEVLATHYSKVTNDKYKTEQQDLKDLLVARHIKIRISALDRLISSWQSHRTQSCYQIFGSCTGLLYDKKYIDLNFFISNGFINLEFILSRTKNFSDSVIRISPQEIENIALLRRFLGSSRENRQSCLANKALIYLIQKIGIGDTLKSQKMSLEIEINQSRLQPAIWSGDTTNLGFMARDNGAFGSLCLADCYGEESSGQERCYYDDYPK